MLTWTLGLACGVSGALTFGFTVALGRCADHLTGRGAALPSALLRLRRRGCASRLLAAGRGGCPAGWVPVMGLFLPMLTVRFLDGRVPRRWPPIDRLATARKIAIALSNPIGPRGPLVAYLPIAPKLLAHVAPALALAAHLGFQPLSGSQGARRL
jgi:hypothetical protein